MIDYEKLKQLRADTGVSFSLCKKALEESKNDMKLALSKLHEWGAKKASEKSGRETKEGALFSYVHHNKRIASLLELQSETDFVAGNSEFQSLGQELAMQIASVPAQSVAEFLKQEYIRDPKKTIDGLIKESILKFGENINVARMARWELGSE